MQMGYLKFFAKMKAKNWYSRVEAVSYSTHFLHLTLDSAKDCFLHCCWQDRKLLMDGILSRMVIKVLLSYC